MTDINNLLSLSENIAALESLQRENLTLLESLGNLQSALQERESTIRTLKSLIEKQRGQIERLLSILKDEHSKERWFDLYYKELEKNIELEQL